jgi:hypothetical protein
LPAPHFKLVAQPNEWTKATRKAAAAEAGPASGRDLRHKEFLGSILEEVKRRKPDLTSASRVGAKSYYYLGAGRAGFLFGYNFSGKGFNVELYMNPKPVELNKALFDALQLRETEINAAIGYPLLWERLDNRLGSRVTARREGGSAGTSVGRIGRKTSAKRITIAAAHSRSSSSALSGSSIVAPTVETSIR